MRPILQFRLFGIPVAVQPWFLLMLVVFAGSGGDAHGLASSEQRSRP